MVLQCMIHLKCSLTYVMLLWETLTQRYNRNTPLRFHTTISSVYSENYYSNENLGIFRHPSSSDSTSLSAKLHEVNVIGVCLLASFILLVFRSLFSVKTMAKMRPYANFSFRSRDIFVWKIACCAVA